MQTIDDQLLAISRQLNLPANLRGMAIQLAERFDARTWRELEALRKAWNRSG